MCIRDRDITGEKYSQSRSFFLNGKLLEENGLEEAFALVYKDIMGPTKSTLPC